MQPAPHPSPPHQQQPTRPAPLGASPLEAPAQLAKAALRRLAQARLEPTPDNYARAYAIEAGEPTPAQSSAAAAAASAAAPAAAAAAAGAAAAVAAAASAAVAAAAGTAAAAAMPMATVSATHPPAAPAIEGPALAALIDRIVRGVERGGRHWTAARRKDGLRRVLDGSRADAVRLQQRLSQLVSSWETDAADPSADTGFGDLAGVGGGGGGGGVELADTLGGDRRAEPGTAVGTSAAALTSPVVTPPAATPPADTSTSHVPKPHVATGLETDTDAGTDIAPAWLAAVTPLTETLRTALPPLPAQRHPLADELDALALRLRAEGPTAPLVAATADFCGRAVPVLQHRHHLVDQLGSLCLELTASLTDLAENDSWAQGQCQAMRVKIAEGLSARGIRAVHELLRDTRQRHGRMRGEREAARESLKGLIGQMLAELAELGSRTGQFHDSVGRYAGVIEQADSLESLADAVRGLVTESRTVQALVQQTQTRLQDEHGRATWLSQRVATLEDDMRRLSDEVSTDQLTQIANRRGLLQAFDSERAQAERQGEPLAIGLLDIDNFKRLNDELGHGAGDEALKALAAVVTKTLRPTDRVARYGGEEFVVLLPATPADEGQLILTRLQRTLTGGLFMHEEKTVFVTFSAGVTAYRPGERIEEALERADQALYQAKRSGKNRTCQL